MYNPAHPKLMDFYEAAFLAQGRGLEPHRISDFRSLVGGLMWPAPTTRVDCLYTVGIHARAMTFPTRDLFNTATRCLIYMGQTVNLGILYDRNAPRARLLDA